MLPKLPHELGHHFVHETATRHRIHALERCRLLERLKLRPPDVAVPTSTALGDWYATILPLRPSHLVLLVNETTRLPVVLQARELKTLDRRIPEAIANVLRDLGVDPEGVAREKQAMAEKLGNEIVSAAAGEGNAVKKKMDVHRMAEANRAFAHFAR